MRKLSFALLILLVSGLVLGGPAARVLARRHGGGRMSGKMHGRMGNYDQDSAGRRGSYRRGSFGWAADLELDESQKTELREKRREWRQTAIDKRAALEKKRLELQGLLSEADVKMPRVRQRVNQLHGLWADLHFAWLKHRQEMKEVLTEEQREKLPAGLLGPGRRGRYHSGGMMGPGRMHRMMGPGRGRMMGPGRGRMMGPGRGRMMGPGRGRMMGPGRQDERGPGRMHRDDDKMHRGPGRGRGREYYGDDEDESRED